MYVTEFWKITHAYSNYVRIILSKTGMCKNQEFWCDNKALNSKKSVYFVSGIAKFSKKWSRYSNWLKFTIPWMHPLEWKKCNVTPVHKRWSFWLSSNLSLLGLLKKFGCNKLCLLWIQQTFEPFSGYILSR